MKQFYLFFFFWLGIACINSPSAEAQTISNITLTELSSQKEIDLNSYNKSSALVVFFTSNYCPYAKLYEDRMGEINKKYQAKGIQIISVNANVTNGHAKDRPEELQKMWQGKSNKSIPYLLDTEQKLLSSLKVTKNPEVVILIPKNNGFEIVYKGAIDDNPQMPQQVKHSYLKDFLEAWVNKKPLPDFDGQAAGCMIKML